MPSVTSWHLCNTVRKTWKIQNLLGTGYKMIAIAFDNAPIVTGRLSLYKAGAVCALWKQGGESTSIFFIIRFILYLQMYFCFINLFRYSCTPVTWSVMTGDCRPISQRPAIFTEPLSSQAEFDTFGGHSPALWGIKATNDCAHKRLYFCNVSQLTGQSSSSSNYWPGNRHRPVMHCLRVRGDAYVFLGSNDISYSLCFLQYSAPQI